MKELVEAIFTTRSDPRSGRLAQKNTPSITSVDPPTFDHGRPPAELTINGTNFVSGGTVKIDGTLKSTEKVTPTKLSVSLAGSTFTQGKLKVVVINPNGDSTAEYEVITT